MGRHLTFSDRKRIEELMVTHGSANRIADALGCSRLTIYNEMRRGGATRVGDRSFAYVGYSAEQAQAMSDENKKHQPERPLRVTGHEEILDKIAMWIREGKSPQTCSDLIAAEYDGLKVARSTIYKYIRTGLIPGITSADCPQNKKRKVG